MDFIAVIAAAVASYIFGAIWYGVLAKPWQAAAGLTVEKLKQPGGPQSGSAMPYVITFTATLIAAGMVRHIMVASGVEGAVSGLITGLGLGLFIATPWLLTNYTFAMRPMRLTVIDGGYATIGSGLMGLVLALFGV